MRAGRGQGGQGSGRGGGRGAGQGTGRGAGRGAGMGQGGQAGGVCVCPACGHRMPHTRGVPCFEIQCPNCGGAMRRADGPCLA